MVPTKTLVNLSEFMSNCDELINGKFIFAINKVSKILKSISDCPEIYEIFSQCLKNFNFSKEFNHAKLKLPTKRGEFVVPERLDIFLPLVFCLLVEVEAGKIELRSFIMDYFYDGEHDEFENFAQKIIVPFKNAVAFCFDMAENPFKDNQYYKNQQTLSQEADTNQSDCFEEFNNEEDIESLEEDIDFEEDDSVSEDLQQESNDGNSKKQQFQQEILTEISGICDVICDNIKLGIRGKQNIKEDCLYVVSGLKKACKKQDLQSVCLLIVSSCYIIKNLKQIRFLGEELKNCLENLLDNLD